MYAFLSKNNGDDDDYSHLEQKFKLVSICIASY